MATQNLSVLKSYMRMHVDLGFTEPMQEGAAKAEVKNYIVERLEYIWFVGMPMAVSKRKPELMNTLLEKHLGLTVAKPEGAGPMHGRGVRGEINLLSRQHLSLKSKKKIKFEHLSSGQRNLFSLISILGSEGDGPILIDEPELTPHGLAAGHEGHRPVFGEPLQTPSLHRIAFSGRYLEIRRSLVPAFG